jgi:hypothetical protein
MKRPDPHINEHLHILTVVAAKSVILRGGLRTLDPPSLEANSRRENIYARNHDTTFPSWLQNRRPNESWGLY